VNIALHVDCLRIENPPITPLTNSIVGSLGSSKISQTMAADDPNGDLSIALLKEILGELKNLKQENVQLHSSVDEINGRVNILAGVKQVKNQGGIASPSLKPVLQNVQPLQSPAAIEADKQVDENDRPVPASPDPSARRSSITSKIILTSYPGQSGVDPCPMEWGDKDPAKRGPVVVSRHPNTIKRRNGKHCSFQDWRPTNEVSDWRSWRLLLNLQCFGDCK
jgi:hypothetical protein